MGFTILVVEDEPLIRMLLREALREADMDPIEAKDGAEAVALAHRADAILLDIRLPDASGLDLLAFFKRERAARPVVMMTGHGTTDTRAAAVARGADHFLDKPFTLGQLFEVVEGLVHTLSKRPQAASSPPPPA